MRLTCKTHIYVDGEQVEDVYVKKQGSFGEYDFLYQKLEDDEFCLLKEIL